MLFWPFIATQRNSMSLEDNAVCEAVVYKFILETAIDGAMRFDYLN